MRNGAIGERALELELGRLAERWEPLDPEELRAMTQAAMQGARRPDDGGARLLRPRPRSATRRRRVVLAFAAAVALVALVAIGAVLFRPAPAAAGVRFSTTHGFIVARVTDPTASAAQLRAAFAEHGLDITLQLLPVSPSLVGTVIVISSEGSGIEALQGGKCITGGGGCPVGLRIRSTYRGHAEITLGRRARPGEMYDSTASAFAPGEPLHCSGLVGARVTRAAAALKARGLSATWRPYLDSGNTELSPASVGNFFVIDADSMAPAKVLVWVAPKRANQLGKPELERYLKALSRGC